MIWFLYNIVFAVGYLFLLPGFIVRMCRRGGYREDFPQRFGRYSRCVTGLLEQRRRIWIHAVSVGEVYVALRFMREMRGCDPKSAFILTTTTSTGRRLAAEEIEPPDLLLYFPLDFPCVIRRALRRLNPEALLLVESELWPNLIRLAHRQGIPVFLINGRISDASYRKYRPARFIFRRVAQCVELFLVQTGGDEGRLRRLGAPADRIRVMGSSKYDDVSLDTTPASHLGPLLGACGMGAASAIVLGGSTWPGEEAALMRAYKNLKPDFPALRLVLVPRHVERSDDIAAGIATLGLKYERRSALAGANEPERNPDVLLVDTTGELKHFYQHAAVIFVGPQSRGNCGFEL